jgi:hypothetical protein
VAIIFSDTFTGTDGAAPAADWTVSGTTGATETIQSNALQLHTGTLGTFSDVSRVILTKTGTTLADFEVLVSFVFTTTFPPTYSFCIFGRGSGDWNNNDNPDTWCKAEISTDGSVSLGYRLASGTKTTIVSGGAGTVTGLAAGQPFFCRYRQTGTSIAAKWWKNDGGVTPEPASWTLSGTQTAVTAAGKIQIRNLGGNAATSLDLSLDNFSLDNLVGSTGVGWYSRGGSRRGRGAARDFAHKRSSF